MIMFSDKYNIQILCALMQSKGIKHVVLCPGSRNAPLVHTLVASNAFICMPITDERSAAFVALGISDATHSAVAVCCTSGSALLNMAPAVAEAFYRNRPLLVISADRPEAWIGQMDGQTLPQPNAFGSLVHASVSLPEPETDEQRWHCQRLVNEALISLRFGPAHINVPVTEPLFGFNTPTLPKVRPVSLANGNLFSLNNEALLEWQSAQRPMIIIGQMLPNSVIRNCVKQLSEMGCLVVAEHIANVDYCGALQNIDEVLKRAENIDKPDMVIYLGGHIVSKPLKAWLRKAQSAVYWHQSDCGKVVDLFQCLTKVVSASAEQLLVCLLEHKPLNIDKAFAKAWIDASQRFEITELSPEQSLISELLKMIPSASVLQLANSSTIRDVQKLNVPQGIDCYCNRGTSGIEGSLSTAVGFAMGCNNLVFCIIGDLSFFYDMNALWNTELPSNLRVLLINNGCGAIFHKLPGLKSSEYLDKYVAASHNTTAAGWAGDIGIEYLSVEYDLKHNDLNHLFGSFVDKTKGTQLIEVIIKR